MVYVRNSCPSLEDEHSGPIELVTSEYIYVEIYFNNRNVIFIRVYHIVILNELWRRIIRKTKSLTCYIILETLTTIVAI